MQNNNNNVIYFDSFGVEHIPKEIRAYINNNNDNNNKNIIPGTKKYWVDVQQGIVSSHGERDPL